MTVYILWGGRDIHPSLYNKEKNPWCGFTDVEEDLKEIKEIQIYVNNNIPLIGVCRGGQLLNVFNDGTMYQHINDHTVNHKINAKDHDNVEYTLNVNSLHHQAMLPGPDGIVLATSEEKAYIPEIESYEYINEIIYYPKNNHFCIQPHPEFLSTASVKFSPFIKYLEIILRNKINWQDSYKVAKGNWIGKAILIEPKKEKLKPTVSFEITPNYNNTLDTTW